MSLYIKVQYNGMTVGKNNGWLQVDSIGCRVDRMSIKQSPGKNHFVADSGEMQIIHAGCDQAKALFGCLQQTGIMPEIRMDIYRVDQFQTQHKYDEYCFTDVIVRALTSGSSKKIVNLSFEQFKRAQTLVNPDLMI